MQTNKFAFKLIALLLLAAFILPACGGASGGVTGPDVAQGYTGTKVAVSLRT